jgi:hypothetical protein
LKKLLLLSALLISSLLTQAQQLTNPGLESWTNVIIYYTPNNWGHTNILVPLGNPTTVRRSTDKRSGSYSAQLDTKILNNNPSPDTLPDTIPGSIFTGTASISSQVFGIPYTYRIAKVNFWYKYTPVGIDTAVCYALLFKYNSTTGMRDTIADGLVKISGTNTSWLLSELDLIYRSPDIPDSLGVIWGSSIPGQGIPNSSIKIDDISVSLPTGIQMDFPQQNLIDIFPQPAFDQVSIRSLSFNLPGSIMEIYDVNSKLVHSTTINSDLTELDISTWDSGIYFSRFISPDGRLLGTSKLLKAGK